MTIDDAIGKLQDARDSLGGDAALYVGTPAGGFPAKEIVTNSGCATPNAMVYIYDVGEAPAGRVR